MIRLRMYLLSFALPAALLLASAAPASAATTYTWLGNAGGNFQTAANWSPNTGFPGAADTALFSAAATYNVTFTGNVTNTGLQLAQQVGTASPTFAMTSGQTYTVSGANAFSVGGTSFQTSNLKITGGTLSLTSSNSSIAGNGAGIGAIQGAVGNLTVDGIGTSFTTNANFCDVGVSGTGTVQVQNGGSVTLGSFSTLGTNSIGNGAITVTGTGSTLSIGNALLVGNAGTGAVTVAGGATASIGASCFMANSVSTNGTITVTGVGSSLTLGINTTIGVLGTGTFAVNNGATASVGSSMLVSAGAGSTGIVVLGQTGTGTLTLNGATFGTGPTTNAFLTVQSGSTLNSNGPVTINTNPSDLMLVNGAWNQNSSTITVQSGTLSVSSGTLLATAVGGGISVTGGNLNVNGGAATVLNLTRSGTGLVNVTNGTLTILGAYNNSNSAQVVDGNTVSASPLLVYSAPTVGGFVDGVTDLFVGLNRRGSVLVNNASTLTASDLILGNAAGSNGTITINSSSQILLSGTSPSYVGLAGAGALVANVGTLNTAGGSVIVGYQAGASGSIDVNAGAIALGSGTLTVGNSGSGSLLVRNGGTVTQTIFAIIGNAAGGVGTATVTGSGSTWTASFIEVGVNGGAGSLTVQAGGAVTNTQTSYVGYAGGTGAVNLSGGSWTASQGYIIGDPTGAGGAGVVNVSQGGSLSATSSGVVTLNPGGVLNIAGGFVTAGGISAQGGRITWSSGALAITGAGGLTLDNLTFGIGVSLGTPQALTVTGTLTVPSTQSLTLAGGSITAGSIVGPGPINLQTGSLQVTNSSVTIGAGNSLGTLVTVGPGLTLRVTNAAQTFAVAADGVLNLTGGTVTAGLMTNAGEIDFGSPVAALGAAGQQLTNSGRLAGTGRINANLFNNANGRVSVDAGQRLVFAGATNNNQLNGTIEMTGGTVEFTGTLNNNSGSLISGHGTFRGSSANTSGVGLVNIGAVALTGTSDVFGKVQNNSGGSITIGGGAVVTFHDDFTNNGTQVFIGAGARASYLGTANGASPYSGTGTAEFLGDLRPGNSPASVSFAGDLVLGAVANLHAEIGGTTLGAQYDHLQVAGNLSFAGNFDAQLINGFTPSLGQRFDIATFGARQGNFTSFTGLALGGGLVFTAGFDASHFYVAVTPPAAPGLSTWTGTTSGFWNDGSNWAPTGVPASSINTQLAFGVTPNAAMTNDIPGGLILNQLTFFSVAPVYSLAGNGLDFRTNGSGVQPQIVLNSLNGVTIAAPITLTNGLTVSGIGNLTLNGTIGGAGSLTYSGSATLTLGGTGSNYSGGTIVNQGTVRTTATNMLPAGGPVSVIAGTLDLGGTSQSIGALNLSSIATTTASPRPIVQGGGAAGLTLGGDITYTPKANGSPSALISSVLNLGGATRTINVTASGGDAYDVVITNHITGAGGLTTAGPGRVVLTSTSSYSGATTITGGPLFLAAVNALPATSPVVLAAGTTLNASPAITTAEVVAGNYNQTLGSVAGPATATVTLLAGTLTLGSDNTNATFSGTLNIPGGTLVKVGGGTQTLGGIDSQINTTVNGGTLAVTTDTALGTAGSPVTVNAFGTLTYSASATTVGRAFILNSGTMSAAAGQTATLNNDTIAGGFIAGPGAFIVTGGTALSGGTTTNSAVVMQTGAAAFANFSNGGALTVAAGPAVPGSFTRFTNQGSGSIIIAAASVANVSDFQTYGTLTLNPAVVGGGQFTELVNVGASPMYFNGGSRTFIGTAATAGPPGNPNFVAGFDLGGKNAVVAGGLFVNNGFVADSGPAGTATIIADFGSLVKGAGFFQNPVVTQNGGRFQAGNSPGSAAFGRFVFGPGGVDNYVFAIDDATGVAGPSPDALGHVIGWSLVNAVQRSSSFSLSSSGDFTWTATPAAKLTIAIDTLINPTTVGTDVVGPMADFDPTRSYVWPAVKWTGTYNGPTDAATLNADTAFETSGFANPIAGTFGWALSDSSLSLSYSPTPVPEPGTLVLTGLAGLAMASRWRRRRTA